MSDFLARTEAMISAWHGVDAPNEPARRMAADLTEVIRAFEALRSSLRFEDEPASFEAALLEAMERPNEESSR